MTLHLGAAVLAAAVFFAGSAPARALDASPWDEVLQAHAQRGGVDYEGLKADAEAMAKLDRFLASVAAMPESENLAAWLNAYNAIVVKSVVSRYPIDSVRSVPGFFDRETHRVAGAQRTLDSIENEIIRPRFRDARIHAALNCGARSCPALYPRAFQQGSLNRVLDRLAQAMVRSNQHVRITEDGGLQLSELFFWFESDFTRDGGGTVRGWLDRYDATDRLDEVAEDAEASRLRYSWRLNDR